MPVRFILGNGDCSRSLILFGVFSDILLTPKIIPKKLMKKPKIFYHVLPFTLVHNIF